MNDSLPRIQVGTGGIGVTTTAAGGATNDIQYNNAGLLAGSTSLTWNGATLAVTGAITATSTIGINGVSTFNESMIVNLPDTTGNGILVTADSLTSGTGIRVQSANAGWAGSTGLFDAVVSNAGATGSAIRASNSGTGHGIYALQGGVTATNKYALFVDSNAIQVNSVLSFFRQDNASSTKGIFLLQNDGTGDAITLNQNGEAQGFVIASQAVASTVIESRSDGIYTGTGFNAAHRFALTHASSTGVNAEFRNAGTGNNIFVDQNENGWGIYIDKDCTVNDTRTFAMKIDSDNAGTGTALPGGIDFSSMSTGEPVFKFVNQAITVAGTLSKQVAVDVQGTTYYMYLYTTGS